MRLDHHFWRRFAKTTWEKKSVTFNNVDSSLLEMDADHIFNSLVQYSDRARKQKETSGLKFYVNGHRQLDKAVLKLLPRKSDRSLAGYHDRMAALFLDYCLVCDELLQFNHATQKQLNEFTMGLYREVGLPNRFAEIGLYLGNYRKTPFGVHVDGCGVFSFPIVGAKRFRIWKPSYAAKHPSLERSFHYAKHKAASKTLDAKVGDMTYWPSSAWHIAESNGSFSATWSLGVWVDQTHLSDVTKIVSDVIARHRHPLSMSGTTRFDGLNLASGEVRSLPKAYLDSLETLRKLSPANMRAEFMKAWLMHTSKQGLKPSPGNSRVSTDRKRAVIALRDSNSHVRWIFSKDDRCYYYSYNGVLTEGSTSKKFLKLIRALNNGAMFSKEQATKIRSALPAHDRMALRMLSDAGAFRSEATSQPL